MNFPGDCGCEFYEGDADVIGDAISAANWMALRNGTAARSFVGFPTFIIGAYVVELTAAIGSVIQQPNLQINEGRIVAGEDGHWSANVIPVDWVAAMGSVTEKDVPLVIQRWKEECVKEYDEVEDWQNDELRDRLYRLTLLCKEAQSRGSDVVFLYL